MNALKTLAVLAALYFGSMAVAGVALFATIGITTGMGPGRTGDVMMRMLAVDAGVCLLATLGSFVLTARWVPGAGWRILIALGYGVMSLLSLGMIGFMSAVILNR